MNWELVKLTSLATSIIFTYFLLYYYNAIITERNSLHWKMRIFLILIHLSIAAFLIYSVWFADKKNWTGWFLRWLSQINNLPESSYYHILLIILPGWVFSIIALSSLIIAVILLFTSLSPEK